MSSYPPPKIPTPPVFNVSNYISDPYVTRAFLLSQGYMKSNALFSVTSRGIQIGQYGTRAYAVGYGGTSFVLIPAANTLYNLTVYHFLGLENSYYSSCVVSALPGDYDPVVSCMVTDLSYVTFNLRFYCHSALAYPATIRFNYQIFVKPPLL